MHTLIMIVLIIIAIILVIGIIRIIIKPSDSFIGFLVDIMLLDWMSDILGEIFEDIDFD